MADFAVRYVQLDPYAVEHKIVRNPNYEGLRLSLNDWRGTPLRPVSKPGFDQALEASVRREGFRNPIVVYLLPEGHFLSFGGSRLTVARRIGKPVPALVCDYVGKYKRCPAVTPDNWTDFFEDPPRHFEFTEYGIDTHYALERKRRADYDPAGFEWVRELDDREFLDNEFDWLGADGVLDDDY